VTEDERREIEKDLFSFIDMSTKDDEALLGNNSSSIFESSKVSAADWISRKKEAEDKKLKGNECMKSKEF